MKEIIPAKLVIEFNPDGTFKEGICLYRLKIDGGIDMRKTYSMSITNGIQKNEIEKILSDSKNHIKKGEGI